MSEQAQTQAAPAAASQDGGGQGRARTVARRKTTKKQGLGQKEIHLFGNGVKLFSKKEQVHLFKGLASMLKAQISTADALKFYANGHPNKVLAGALLAIAHDVNDGISIHEAFRRSKKFDEMTIGLVQAGGDSGQLYQAFADLSKRITTEMAFRKKIKKAVMIPCIVIPILMGAFIGSQVKIVPQVKGMMSGMRQEPDGMIGLSFTISEYTQQYWVVVVLSLIAIVVTIFLSSAVKNVILNICMARVKVIRQLIMSLRQMTFLSTMKLLYSNGISLSKSIKVSANSVKGTPFYSELNAAADKYEKQGLSLSNAFGKYTSVDQQVVHMLAIGEKSASIDVQLGMLAEMYEESADELMDAFTGFISTVVLIMAGVLVAAIFIGTFMPIFLMGPKMMNQAH